MKTPPTKIAQIVENTGNKVIERIVRPVETALTDRKLEHLKNLTAFIRPIFQLSPKRIKSHIAISLMAL